MLKQKFSKSFSIKMNFYYQKKSFIIFLLLLFSFVSSCDNPINDDNLILPVCDDTTHFPLLKDWLIPLTEGNYWEYKLESHFNEDSIPLFTSYTTQRILGNFKAFTECNEYETVIYDRGFGTEEQWIYWQDSTGFYSLGGFSDSDTLVFTNLISKYPVNVGDEWQNRKVIYKSSSQEFILGDTINYKCTAIDKRFTTSLGTFNCYVYYRREKIADDVYGFYDIYDYMAPNLGQVGQEVFITGEEPSDSISYLYNRAILISYHLQLQKENIK